MISIGSLMGERLPLIFRHREIGSMTISEDGKIDGQIDMHKLSAEEKIELTWVSWAEHLSIDVGHPKE